MTKRSWSPSLLVVGAVLAAAFVAMHGSQLSEKLRKRALHYFS